jgi:hypothetical protein
MDLNELPCGCWDNSLSKVLEYYKPKSNKELENKDGSLEVLYNPITMSLEVKFYEKASA